MRILIAEDDFISRRLMQNLMARYGTYEIAVNGREAIELYKIACDEGNRFNVICLDINMPEIDGQEALRQIRDIESSYGIEGLDRTKIVMTTAYSNFENVSKAFEEQCDAYLVKPIELRKLDETMEKLGLIKKG